MKHLLATYSKKVPDIFTGRIAGFDLLKESVQLDSGNQIWPGKWRRQVLFLLLGGSVPQATERSPKALMPGSF